jgi:hypothetical protein
MWKLQAGEEVRSAKPYENMSEHILYEILHSISQRSNMSDRRGGRVGQVSSRETLICRRRYIRMCRRTTMTIIIIVWSVFLGCLRCNSNLCPTADHRDVSVA